MILNFYKSNQIAVLFLLPVIGLAFWLPGFINPTEIKLTEGSPIFQWIYTNLSPISSRILALSIILVSALILNNVINNHEIFDSNTFLPALIYVVVMSSIKEYQILTPIVFTNFFWILAFRRLFNIYRQIPCKQEVFDATLFIVAGALFYFPSIIMLLVIWGALKALRPFVWREWVIPLIAVLLFAMYLLVFSSWSEGILFLKPYLRMNSGQYHNIEIDMTWTYYAVIGILVILINLSAYQLSYQSKGSSLRFRKIASFFMTIIILSIVIISIVKYFAGESVYLLVSAVPLSLLLTFYFYYAKKAWLSNILFYSVFIILLVNIYS